MRYPPADIIPAVDLHRCIIEKFPVPFGTGNFICNSVVALCVFDAWFGNVDFELIASHGIGIVHADGLICISL